MRASILDGAIDAPASDRSTETSAPKFKTVRIDHADNIIGRAKAFHPPDKGDVLGVAKLRFDAIMDQIRQCQNERDKLAIEMVILEAELESDPLSPAAYNAPTTLPRKTPPQSIPSLIREERERARGMRKAGLVATSALVPALGIMVIEITLLSEVLGYGMPEVAGDKNVSTGLLAMAFASVVAGAFFALEKAGPRVRSVMDKIGAGAVLAYVVGAGVALGLKGSGLIGKLDSPDLSQATAATDWNDAGASMVELAATSLVDTLGSGALALALMTVTILSVIAIEHLLRIALDHAGTYLTKRSSASRADALEADLKRIVSEQRRIKHEIHDLEEKLGFVPRDVAAEINALAAPHLAKAEEQLAQMTIVKGSQAHDFDLKAFALRILDFRDGIAVEHLRDMIARADF